jgi:hypothetical protein
VSNNDKHPRAQRSGLPARKPHGEETLLVRPVQLKVRLITGASPVLLLAAGRVDAVLDDRQLTDDGSQTIMLGRLQRC